MNRIFTAALSVLGVSTLLLSACGSDEQEGEGEYRAVCQDPRTGAIYQDYALCESPHSFAAWYWMPTPTFHELIEVEHRHYVAGGSSVQPTAGPERPVKIQYPGRKPVTVYAPTKQAGAAVKNNQDAKKVSTVTGKNAGVSSYTQKRANVIPAPKPAVVKAPAPAPPKAPSFPRR